MVEVPVLGAYAFGIVTGFTLALFLIAVFKGLTDHGD